MRKTLSALMTALLACWACCCPCERPQTPCNPDEPGDCR